MNDEIEPVDGNIDINKTDGNKLKIYVHPDGVVGIDNVLTLGHTVEDITSLKVKRAQKTIFTFDVDITYTFRGTGEFDCSELIGTHIRNVNTSLETKENILKLLTNTVDWLAKDVAKLKEEQNAAKENDQAGPETT